MRSQFANLRTLVLPAGAGAGRRIVLDGVNGRIDVYDDTDTLVARLDDDGLHIVLPDGDIYLNEALGFYLESDTGAALEARTDPAVGAILSGLPATVPGRTFTGSGVYTSTFPGLNDVPYLALASPSYLTPVVRALARIYLLGEDDIGTPPKIDLRATGPTRVLDGQFEAHHGVSDGTRPYLKGQQGTEPVSVTAADFDITAVVFPVPFAVGTVPVVVTNIQGVAGIYARWGSRAVNVTRTGFDLFIFSVSPAGVAATFNVDVDWVATVTG